MQRIDTIHAAREFYGMEALRLMAKCEPFRHSHEKWSQDLAEYRDAYAARLEAAIYDYSALVVAGELRHGRSNANRYVEAIPQGGGRSGVYKFAKEYTPASLFLAGIAGFDASCGWASSFGGTKWQQIAKTGAKRKKYGRIPFIDTCFSLSHNTSPYFNKSDAGIFMISDAHHYKNFLDIKRNETPNEVLARVANVCGFRLRQFIIRAINLELIPYWYAPQTQYFAWERQNADEAEDLVLAYTPVEWGTEELPCAIKKSNSWVDDIADSDDDDDDGSNDTPVDEILDTIFSYSGEPEAANTPYAEDIDFDYGMTNFEIVRSSEINEKSA